MPSAVILVIDRATEKGVVSDVRLDGRPIEPARAYRVTVPAFLASGGDSFTSLRDGTERTEGPIDVDGLTAYLGKVSSATVPLGPLAGRRIEGDGCR